MGTVPGDCKDVLEEAVNDFYDRCERPYYKYCGENLRKEMAEAMGVERIKVGTVVNYMSLHYTKFPGMGKARYERLMRVIEGSSQLSQ